MKTLLASSTLAAALAAVPVHAGEAPAPRPVPKLSATMDAMMSMARELQPAAPTKLPMRERLDALAEFRHSPETAQKLLKVYGTERPWTLARLPVANGRYDYIGTLAPLHYTGEAGETWDWAPLTVKLGIDKASRNMTMHAAWPSVTAEDKNLRFTLRDLSMTSKQKRGFGDIWFGDGQINIGNVAFEAKGSGPNITIDDIRVRSKLIERPKVVDMVYDSSVKSIGVAGEKIDNVRVYMRMTNIDKTTMAELKTLGDNAGKGATPEQRLASMQPALKTMGKALIQRGTAIEIDDFSLGYKGNTASLKGRISVEGASEADLGAMPSLLKKIVARFNVRVPVALLKDVLTTVAAKQASAQAKGPANPQTVAQISQSIYDVVIGKLVGGGYARIEKDVLLSDIEIRGGVVRVNGKEVTLPKPGASPPPVPAPSPAIMPGRRIPDRCVLPAYPDDVMHSDLPFSLSIHFVVKADGSVADIALLKMSGDPVYDQALLAAMEHCVYIPGLVNGKAVDMPTTWIINRAPGETRP